MHLEMYQFTRITIVIPCRRFLLEFFPNAANVLLMDEHLFNDRFKYVFRYVHHSSISYSVACLYIVCQPDSQ